MAGKQEGTQKNYRQDGTLESTEDIKKGQRYGFIRTYDTQGNLQEETSYRANMKAGTYRKLHANQKNAITGMFRYNKQNGEWKEFSPEGKLLKTSTYQEGKLINEKVEKTEK